MSGLTSLEIIALVFIIFLGVVVAGLFLYLLKRLKRQRSKILSELDRSPRLSQDRAFNRLAMARREAGILARQGVDVRRAQELIAESQGAFDTRQYDRSYQVAQSAHEALVVARQKGAPSTDAPLPSSVSAQYPKTGPAVAVPSTPVPVASSPSVTPAVKPAIPKNRAESQFQIRLLGEELAALPPRRARDSSGTQATALHRQATEAFDKEEYTEAFRLALRGRRALGGHLETLAPTGAGAGRATGTGNGGGPAPDLARTAESVAGGERCPECGYPALAGDSFCRGCGRPHATMTCPACGAVRGAEEAFCGRCGARFP